MKKNILFLFLFVLIFPYTSNCQIHPKALVFKHDSVFSPGRFFFNHTPQIEVIDSGSILPNGDTLNQEILVVSAISGFSEGETDQTFWCSRSLGNSHQWSYPKTIGDTTDTLGNHLIWNASLFKTRNNSLIQFYMFQRNRGAGATGNEPIYLKKKISTDGGLTWSTGSLVDIRGIPDTSTFRIFGPYTKPIRLSDDSVFFPLYFRIAGNPNAYFATLKSDTNFNSFSINLNYNIYYPHPQRLIEPTAIFRNDTIFVFFRTSRGWIDYVYSIDNGLNWSQICYTDIKNPNTLFTAFSNFSNNYMIANFNSSVRDDLAFLKLNNENQVQNVSLLDYLTFPYEQVSYPNHTFSKAGDILYVYSMIGMDFNSGSRFGDIFFNRIPSNFDFDSCVKLPVVLPEDSELEGLKIPSSVSALNSRNVLFGNDFLILFSENNLTYERVSLINVQSIYDVISLQDSIIVFSNTGVGLYNRLTTNYTFFNSLKLFGKTKRSKFGCYVNIENNYVNLYDQNFGLVRKFSLPSVSQYFPTWNHPVDAILTNDDSTIFIITLIGKLYKCNFKQNALLEEIYDFKDFASKILTFKDKIIFHSRRGNVYMYELNNQQKIILFNNYRFSSLDNKSKIFSNHIFTCGSNFLFTYNLDKQELVDTLFCLTQDIKLILRVSEDSIYMLNNFGGIFAVRNPFLNIHIFSDDLQGDSLNYNLVLDFKIFPNPTNCNSNFVIEANNIISRVDICNPNGSLVFSDMIMPGVLHKQYSFNLNGITKGLYFVSVVDSYNNTKTKKIIIN
jgi:hypothetical protein